MPITPSSIGNAYRRHDVYHKQKKHKGQEKLKRRLETKKDEADGLEGAERKKKRLAENIPKTIDNTRIFGTSYLTSDPNASASASSSSKPPKDDDDSDDDSAAEEHAEELDLDNEGGIGAIPANRGEDKDPRILLTTSAKATRETYTFAEELRGIFPGGEFFKRPAGKGYELGRIGRWAGKRGYDAVIVINEDRKIPNAITIMNLPNGPTAYFKLTSVQLSKAISGHARPTPHSPELILNNFQTRLGLSIGRLFGSLFPPLPQFEGRQVVTLHNQRDFLFFRRHRYMFKSIDKTALQEIGPRFTLKLRWLRKGLPAVTGGGSVATAPEQNTMEEEDDDRVSSGAEDEEDDAEEVEMKGGRGGKKGKGKGTKEPKLDGEDEFEWKWKPKLEVSRKTFFL
ncbi:anticodon-binding protein [Mrakia frigida]|uniref:rRNA-binding ribosome biosynthesis protein RPF1 n=1 Tax=Mrakia frigida TaxID=29902 RepID=UPI003FCC001B